MKPVTAVDIPFHLTVSSQLAAEVLGQGDRSRCYYHGRTVKDVLLLVALAGSADDLKNALLTMPVFFLLRSDTIGHITLKTATEQ